MPSSLHPAAPDPEARILVAIASYGNKNDRFLEKLLEQYAALRQSVDIVVLSNIPRSLAPGIEVIVGLPAKDPWSLPFGHKQLFADRLKDYDLFIYSEDDTLVTQKNVDAFLAASRELPSDYVPGFLRYEECPDGSTSYPDVHHNYHWDVSSTRNFGPYTFAFFTNEHAAVYMLTRSQLQKAIDSGGFLVGPHQGKYDLLVSAATDPYTQCGLTKLVSISHLEDFVLHHLPNRYAQTLGLAAPFFESQRASLLSLAHGSPAPGPLLPANGNLRAEEFAKSYYEPARQDLIGLIPPTAQTVLSIGCGWGATELAISKTGRDVLVLPLDRVIAACFKNSPIEVLSGSFSTLAGHLRGRKIDCILISNLLHLMEDPAASLAALTALLTPESTVIVSVPNLLRAQTLWRRFSRRASHRYLGDYSRSGIHSTSHHVVKSWLNRAGMKVQRFADVLPAKADTLARRTFGMANFLLATEIVAVAGKGKTAPHPVTRAQAATEALPPARVEFVETCSEKIHTRS